MTCPASEPSPPQSSVRLLLQAVYASLVITATQVQAEQTPSTETSVATEPAAAASAADIRKRTAAPDSSVEWQALNSGQRQLLAALQSEWNSLSPSRKGKWLELAARYPTMPADEQQRMQQRISSWAQLSPAERQQARLAFRAARDLKADERQAKWEAYQALPSERRQALSDKASQKQQGQPISPPKPMLVPLIAPDSPDRPLGPILLQAKPGASTMLIGTGKPQLKTPRSGQNLKTVFDQKLLDSHTLLPKPRRAPGNN